LYTLLFVHRFARAPVTKENILPLVRQIIDAGKRDSHGDLMGYTWHGKRYVGAAHGITGIMHTLLLTESIYPGTLSDHDKSHVFETIDAILKLRRPNGNTPSSVGSKNIDLVHWCHGAPGIIPLLALAASQCPSRRDAWMEVAANMTDIVWRRGLLRKVVEHSSCIWLG
jgi:lantibiotic modifying enzyme